MSVYELHKAMHDRLGRFSTGEDGPVPVDDYRLTDAEREALQTDDIGALYGLGAHPVLLNAYCRALGVKRDDYRAKLAPYATAETRRPRWRNS